jgi:hypothetical protein
VLPSFAAAEDVHSVLTARRQHERIVDLATLEQVDTPGHHLRCPAAQAFGLDAAFGRYHWQ